MTSHLYYLRDPNCGDEQFHAFQEASESPECLAHVDNSGPAEGGGEAVLEVGGQNFYCPVGLGMVVVK